MEITKKTFAVVLVTTLILGYVSGYAFNTLNKNHGITTSKANVYLTLEDYNGVHDLYSGNLITNIGENQTGIRMFENGTYTALYWIAVSNDATPLATWSKLPNEINANGFTRQKGTISEAWYNSNDWAKNVTTKFTATGSQQLQATMLHYLGTPESDNNGYATASFTQTTFEIGWNLTITWIITYDGN